MSLRGDICPPAGSKILTFGLKARDNRAYQILFFCYCEALCMNEALKGALHIKCIIVTLSFLCMQSHSHSLAVMHDGIEVIGSIQVVGLHLCKVRFRSCTGGQNRRRFKG